MKPLLICLIGPSGSGKTSLSMHLQKTLNIPPIVSYTTRPMRFEETQGVEHHFVSEWRIPPRNRMLAHTVFHGYDYWTELKQIDHDIMTYTIDEKGLLELEKKHGDKFNIFSVYIQREEEELVRHVGTERVDRDKERLKLPLGYYSLVIENDCNNLDAFLYMGNFLISKALKKWQQTAKNQ